MTLVQLYDIADQNDIAVYHFPLYPVKSVSVPGTIGIDADQVENDTEEKHLLAHELGHCIKYAFYTGNSTLELRAQKEYRANKWAVEALIPLDDLSDALENGITEIWELAEYFNASEHMIEFALRLYEESLIQLRKNVK